MDKEDRKILLSVTPEMQRTLDAVRNKLGHKDAQNELIQRLIARGLTDWKCEKIGLRFV